jgi:DNA transformation protein and related proteins
MAKDSGFHTYIMEDIFASFPGITSKAMFGGYGIYKDGYVFAIIADDKLYFKVDEIIKKDFVDRGCKQFTYTGKDGKQMAMMYYEVPENILEDRHALGNWIQKSLFVSMREKLKKKKATSHHED